MQEQSRLKYLFDRWYSLEATEAEAAEFKELLQKEGGAGVIEDIAKEAYGKLDERFFTDEQQRKIVSYALGKQAPAKVLKVWRRAVAVAAVLILAIGSWWLIEKPGGPGAGNQTAQVTTDIQPGKNGAILTLADGRRIVLDQTGDGKVTSQAVKSGDQLSYESNKGTIEYNTMITPNGRQYSLVLADGSKVWLNAGTSITFPTVFTGNERKVSITGEAYFEVAKDAKRPFIVTSKDQEIQVLGTHFNVNAYEDEGTTKTTLVEGKVSVAAGSNRVVITPGQQAVLNPGSSAKLQINKAADIEEVLGWKNGYFVFKGADLKTIMRQVERWYDVEVVFEGKIPEQRFRGEVSRSMTASGMLKVLERSGVKFEIEGKKIKVKG